MQKRETLMPIIVYYEDITGGIEQDQYVMESDG